MKQTNVLQVTRNRDCPVAVRVGLHNCDDYDDGWSEHGWFEQTTTLKDTIGDIQSWPSSTCIHTCNDLRLGGCEFSELFDVVRDIVQVHQNVSARHGQYCT